MIHAFNFKTATGLHDGLARKLLYGTPDTLDDVNSVDVQLHNVIARAQSFEWDYYVDRLWTTPQRWNTMVRQYLDPESVVDWLDVIEDRFPQSKRGIAVLRTNTVKARTTGRGVTRRWGSCMLSLSFRVKPEPQITLHSRTCYLGYLSVLDISVAYVLAKLAGERAGIKVQDMSFVWQLEMAQYHGFRSIAFPLGDHDEANFFENHERDRSKFPGVYLARMWHDRLLKLDEDGIAYGDMKFSSYKRVRRRWHAQMFGAEVAESFAGGTYSKDGRPYKLIPPTHVNELTLSPIGLGHL